MKIISTNVYVGPNVFALFPVIRHVIDIGVLEDYPSVTLGDDFINGLVAALPTLAEHGCSYGEPGGFLRRLREDEGTWMGHIWEHVVLELQSLAGSDVTFGKTRGTGELGHYNMVYEYGQRDVGLAAGKLGRSLLISLLPDDIAAQLNTKLAADFEFETELHDFIRFAQRKEFGPVPVRWYMPLRREIFLGYG